MAYESSGKFLVFVAVAFAGVYFLRDTSLNGVAPAFSLPATDGGKVELSSYQGQPVLLVFWTTSCGWCRRELPLVNRLAPEFRRKGFAVLTIHLGGSDDIGAYLRENDIDLTSLVDAEGQVGQAYRVGGVPKLVLVGADGKIARVSNGMADEQLLREWMNAATSS